MPGIPNFKADTAEVCEKIEVGDRVRSYDFEFRDDCYVEGVVTAIGIEKEGCPRYQIMADRMVAAGRTEMFVPDYDFYPPVNGTCNWLGGFTNGVHKVEG